MARVFISNNFLVSALILAVFCTCSLVSGLGDDFAPAPAPAREAGSGFSLPVSGAVIGSSLLLSVLHLLRH